MTKARVERARLAGGERVEVSVDPPKERHCRRAPHQLREGGPFALSPEPYGSPFALSSELYRDPFALSPEPYGSPLASSPEPYRDPFALSPEPNGGSFVLSPKFLRPKP